MVDPYRMVVINLITSISLVVGVLFFRYVYPRRKINLLVFVLLISLLPIISIFRNGDYESGDFNVHIYRTIDFYNSLRQGILMPSWAGSLNATYGYPLFIFNYSLPYYFISFIHFLGFSFISSMKIFLALNFLLSGLFMYLAAKKFFNNDMAAFVATIFYQFTPYHLIDLHFKVVIGEIMSITLIPFVFFCLQQFWYKKSGIWFSLSVLSISFLIMTHVVIALFVIALFLVYILFNLPNKAKRQNLLFSIFIFIWASLSSIYVWLTPFFMTKYTVLQNSANFHLFPKFSELLFSPWMLGLLFQGHKGEISILIGYSQIFVFLAISFLMFRKKIIQKNKKDIFFWLISFVVIIFLITDYSQLIWKYTPFLNATGGSHRLLVLIIFVISILSGYLSLHMLKKRVLIWLLIGFTIFSTILNWGHRRIIPGIHDQDLIDSAWKSTSIGEGHWYANSKWKTKKSWFDKLPAMHLEPVRGSAEIKELERTYTSHSYIVSVKNKINFKENTLYFPGWQVFDNNKEISSYPDSDGTIGFRVNSGLHRIDVRYEDVLIYKVLKIISAVSLLSIFGYLLLKFLGNLLIRLKFV